MLFDISKQRLPDVYKRRGTEYFLDPIRKKLIRVTPEEIVRQKIISYLIDKLNIPEEMISVEAHLTHYNIKSKRRADIIIHGVNHEDVVVPIATIECKAPGVILGDKAASQLVDYCNLLGCDYAMMVNDSESFTYCYNERCGEYLQIDNLPQYDELLQGKYKKAELGELPARIPHKDISRFIKENPSQYCLDISTQTEHRLACAAYNLLEALLDPRYNLPEKQYGMFTLVKDYGVRLLSYGNASGGIFNGLYRSFIIEIDKSIEFVSMGLSTYVTHAYPDVEKTSLNIAIDNEKESHHSLQLVLDDNVIVDEDYVRFYHHGRIGISNIGSGRVSELRELIAKKRPELISGKKFYLGSIRNDREWHLNDTEVMGLIENLISYALIRDEYREQVKKLSDRLK